ncbi:MAG: hypothetical protein RBR96_04275 [Candidatus Izemoplasmatales bacterium]|nr:hypothetical protein [Candidatus Izemoplasmatales bacterium]
MSNYLYINTLTKNRKIVNLIGFFKGFLASDNAFIKENDNVEFL